MLGATELHGIKRGTLQKNFAELLFFTISYFMGKENYIQIDSVEGKINAQMVRDRLEEDGIDSYMEPNHASMGIGKGGIFAGKLAPNQADYYWKIYVPEEDAEKAKELIEEGGRATE